MKQHLKAVGMGLLIATGIMISYATETLWNYIFVLFPCMFLMFELTNFYLENK